MRPRTARASRWLPILLAGWLAGCGGDAPLPMDEAVLIDVLTDLHLADARADALAPPDTRDSLRLAYRDDVLGRHGLTPARWSGALDALADQPEALTAAYDSVLARLASEPAVLPH